MPDWAWTIIGILAVFGIFAGVVTLLPMLGLAGIGFNFDKIESKYKKKYKKQG